MNNNDLIIKDNVLVECLNKDIKKVVIPSGVTSIGEEVFAECIDLTEVTIPDSVTSIGEEAFDKSCKLILKLRSVKYE